jgi:hypothetical protein
LDSYIPGNSRPLTAAGFCKFEKLIQRLVAFHVSSENRARLQLRRLFVSIEQSFANSSAARRTSLDVRRMRATTA